MTDSDVGVPSVVFFSNAKQSKLYFATAINPTGGYRVADDVVIDAGGLVGILRHNTPLCVLVSLSTRNMDDTSKLYEVAAMKSLQPHQAAKW
ncbi:hypothetical protein BU17DRAFT_102663 [Hysterangium stoloniferum]|nr:hypothetical protein BU17DRAFT_102663 [Hysterangium stoloniferum]